MSDEFVEGARKLADKYLVPEGPARELLFHAAELMDSEITGLDLVFVSRVWREMFSSVFEDYRPRSPLEAQLEYDRMRNDVRERDGVEVAEWTAADDPVILERWARWDPDA